MDPPNKKRRLAPKLPDPPPSAQHAAQSVADPQTHPSATESTSIPPTHDAPQSSPSAPSERQDFEAFAKHLQDAAIYIYNQGQKMPYAQVSALLLKWDDDLPAAAEVSSLEHILHDRYNFRTERWGIPSVPNPMAKLSNKITDFLDSQVDADHLLIIYYIGHGHNGSDNQLYWACNAHEDSPKLKWEGVRCVLEEATSDILVLLDSCVPNDVPSTGKNGTKQVIAAYGPGPDLRPPGARKFTAYLEEALRKFGNGRPFNSQKLYKEVAAIQGSRERYHSPRPTSNGASQPGSAGPFLLTLTPDDGQTIDLAPMPRGHLPSPQNGSGPDAKAHRRPAQDVPVVSPSAVSDMVFEEAHMLVCTTFVGDASPDMASFKQWIANTPVLASRVSVEGMFLGPPTVLLISIPQSLWGVIEHDKICFSLGYVNSHNLINLYKDVMKVSTTAPELASHPSTSRSTAVPMSVSTSTPNLSTSTTLPPLAAVSNYAQDLEDSRTMPDARKSVSSSTHSPPHRNEYHMPPLHQQQQLPPPPSPAPLQHQHHQHHTHQQVSPHHQQQHHYTSPTSQNTLPPIAHAQQPLPLPVPHRRLSHHLPSPFHDTPPVAPYEPNGLNRRESLPQIQQPSSHHYPASHPQTLPPIGSIGATILPKDDNEDSAEMKEAAEQLKALSRPANGTGNGTGSGTGNETGSPPFSTSSHLLKIAQDVIKCQADDMAPEDAEMKTVADNTSASAKKAKLSKDFRFKTAKDGKTARSRSRSDIMHTQNLPPLLPHGKQEVQCQYCTHEPFKDPSSLRKHIASAHTRPFPCAFAFAGCQSTFGSKNEWKRHIASQHLCLQYYRCSDCSQAAMDGKANEFNRKDLFTQHLRRMHAPPSIRKAIQKRDGKPETEWDDYVKEMQKTCCIIRRRPPQHSACPKPRCNRTFEGRSAWDEWTEHVGRHMESGDGESLGVDSLLISWAFEEGIIAHDEDGTYRLSNPMSGGTGSGNANANGASNGASAPSPVSNGKSKSAAPGANGRSLSSGGPAGEDSVMADGDTLAEISSAAFAIANASAGADSNSSAGADSNARARSRTYSNGHDQARLPPTPPLTTSARPSNDDFKPDEDALTAIAAMAAMNAAASPATITGHIRASPQRMDKEATTTETNDEIETMEAAGQAILELTRVEAPPSAASNSRAEEWRKAVGPDALANGSPVVKKERKPLPSSQKRDTVSLSSPASAPASVSASAPAPAPTPAPVPAPPSVQAPQAAPSIKTEPSTAPPVKAPAQPEHLSGLQSITVAAIAAAAALQEQENPANGSGKPATSGPSLGMSMDVD
ncbi:zinc c2h2 finger domain containing protein [Ophiostoma piceae UAMH 11346]|uniref:Zinc c2h2 finger domain containing protein n=1 Tax=Ophiostoma piceae (strain UAMH 11346) TaxID=1262450 RepID=S3BZF0_OPHP1|nr:zinc c2h2 finger domain containing protein [Ophiostoma piceae UAMH 11346]